MTDDTSLNQDVTTDAGESVAIENKEPALVPSFRLREETEKREKLEAQVAEYESKFAETETQIQQERKNIEKQYAEKTYGADVVNDPAVQEYKEKYPDLEYPQIFGALGVEVPTTAGYAPTPSRPAGALSNSNLNSEYTVSQLGELQSNNPTEYSKVMAEYASGKIKVIAG